QVTATERIEITNTGRVLADIHTPTLTVEEGAFLEGRCSMGPAKPAKQQPASPKVAQIPVAKKG
ncbi:MAG: polymer-forming cytoskeletal protein, partial [Acidobacteriota bacterium]